MSLISKIPTVTILEGTGITFLARIIGWTGAAVQQSDIASGAYSVLDLADLETPIVDAEALTIASVIFDVLQTGPMWTVDSVGYNFMHHVPGLKFPDGAATYRVEYALVPAAAGFVNSPIQLARNVSTLEMHNA